MSFVVFRDKRTGESFKRPCGDCDHCRRMAAMETVEMLVLDAQLGDPPTLMLTLTARCFPTGDELSRTLEKIVRACRRSWPEFDWFITRERQQRGVQHLHALIKHVPTDEESMRLLYGIVTRIWCRRHNAEAHPFEERARGPQGLKLISDVEGVVSYLAKDLTESPKSSQALEIGHHGHRTSHTRPRNGRGGYFTQGTAAAREAARDTLRRRRLAHLLQQRGVTPDRVDAAVDKAIADAKENLEVMVIHHGVLRGLEDLRNPFEQVQHLPVRPRRRSHV